MLGTMLELGERTAPVHREVLERALQSDVDVMIVFGGFAVAAEGHADPRLEVVSDPGAAADVLVGRVGPGDAVLLKASRGIRLEQIIPTLRDAFGGGED